MRETDPHRAVDYIIANASKFAAAKATRTYLEVHAIAFMFDRYENQIQEMLVGFEKRGMIERNAVGKWRFARAKA